MINAENLDAFISILIGFSIAVLGFRRLKKPLPPRPGEMTKSPEEQASRARVLIAAGAFITIMGLFRLKL